MKMMRIARYCTSVLISGRTIPVDVRLLIPHCGFYVIVDLKAKAPKKATDPHPLSPYGQFVCERKGTRLPSFPQVRPGDGW